MNLLNATCHVIIGYFANYGIPRMGEVSRCTLAAKYDKVPFEIGFGTVITERIIDFFLFLVIFFLTLAFQFSKLIGLANELIFDKLKIKLLAISQKPLQMIVMFVFALIVIYAIIRFRKKFRSLFRGKLGGMIRGMADGIGSVDRKSVV